jgi:hypothetical protein
MTSLRQTVVGVFDERAQAERAIGELKRAGFTGDEVGYAIRNVAAGAGAAAAGTAEAPAVDETAGGATTGAITGGLLGGLLGAAVALLIPGVGPIVAGGILASALGGAALGAAAGGLLGALVGMGVPEEEARFYQGEFEAGRAVVTVRAGERFDEAQAILRRHGAYDTGGREMEVTSTIPTAPVAAMTGAVQAETAAPRAALTSLDEERAGRPAGPPGAAAALGDQARIAQRSDDAPAVRGVGDAGNAGGPATVQDAGVPPRGRAAGWRGGALDSD